MSGGYLQRAGQPVDLERLPRCVGLDVAVAIDLSYISVCAAGSYSGSGAAACTRECQPAAIHDVRQCLAECPAGYFCAAGSTSSNFTGRSSDGHGYDSYTQCVLPASSAPRARRQPTYPVRRAVCSLASVCTACAAGTYNALTTQSSSSACLGVLDVASLSGAVSVSVCPAGTYSATGASSCLSQL